MCFLCSESPSHAFRPWNPPTGISILINYMTQWHNLPRENHQNHTIVHINERMNEWMNEWMKSYIAHVSNRRLFRALNIESNLARPVIIQIPTQSPGRYTAELPLRRIKLFSFQANSPYVPSTHTLWIFCGLAGWKLRLRPLRFYYVQL